MLAISCIVCKRIREKTKSLAVHVLGAFMPSAAEFPAARSSTHLCCSYLIQVRNVCSLDECMVI